MAGSESVGTIAEDQEKSLADSLSQVKHHAFFLHRALDANNLQDALKYSAQMLSELRTSKLSPQKYYELYMRTFDELRKLEVYFSEETKGGCTNAYLYELVQHAGNILPRLYLLCTAGSVYIKSKEAPAKDILKDLVEMSRGIQHPIRGLFLRSYLSQISREKLPDIGSEYEGEGGTVMDAVEFVLQNFTEMNKLWVRMQYQGPVREREKREKERGELRDLVGKNLHILGQLEGVDLNMYSDVVLPRVLEQVVNCKDELAQNYLMDCIIQVFPDDFHLQTLDTLLGACPQLQPNVDIKTIMSQLMERLSNYAATTPQDCSSGACERNWSAHALVHTKRRNRLSTRQIERLIYCRENMCIMHKFENLTGPMQVLPDFLQVEAFSKLNDAVVKVIEAQPDMPLAAAVSLHVFLLTFTLRVHADQLDYVDQILGACLKSLEGVGKVKDSKATKQLVALLTAPLDKYNDVLTVLNLTNYPRVMEHLDYGTNKVMSVVIIQSLMKNSTLITSAEKVEALFELMKELLKDTEGALVDEVDEEDFKEEQNLVGRLVHLLFNEDPEEMFKILTTAREHFLQGDRKRLGFTLPPLIFSALKFARSLQCADESDENTVSLKKLFQFLNQTIDALSSVPASEEALRSYLQCAEAANNCKLEPIAYEFFTQAFLLYEEEISDSKAQMTAIHLIVGTLQRMTVFGAENRDTLIHKATAYSVKLLRKPDQCRAVYACSHLFWTEVEGGICDGERVVACLKRALRLANDAQQLTSVLRGVSGPVTLFVEVLNKYLYYYIKECPQVTNDVIQGLVELIVTEMQSEKTTHDPVTDVFFESTLRHIQHKRQKREEESEGIALSQV